MRRFVPIHALEMPIPKNPFWIFDLTYDWCDHGEKNNKFLQVPVVDDKQLEDNRIELLNFPWREHLKWLRDRVPLIKSREVFCHNDMQFPNIFLRQDVDGGLEDKLFVIDYENCSYGFRGFDLAFFLLQKSVNFFKENFLDFVFWPDKSRRRQLLHFYSKEYQQKNPDYDPEIDSLDHLLMEVDFFILLMQLFRTSYIWKKCCPEFLRGYVSRPFHQLGLIFFLSQNFSHFSIQLFLKLKSDFLKDYPFMEKIWAGGTEEIRLTNPRYQSGSQ